MTPTHMVGHQVILCWPLQLKAQYSPSTVQGGSKRAWISYVYVGMGSSNVSSNPAQLRVLSAVLSVVAAASKQAREAHGAWGRGVHYLA